MVSTQSAPIKNHIMPQKRVVSAVDVHKMAGSDLFIGLIHPRLWWFFAMHDIRQRFRRSLLGPLWLTLSLGIMVGALGIVYSRLFHQSIHIFLPYLTAGLIFWTLITNVINEGCHAFIYAKNEIQNLPIPISVHFYRVFARNLIILAFNVIIYFLVLICFPPQLSWNIILFFPGLLLFLGNLIWMSLIVGLLSARFRDIPPIVQSILQVIFFVTPVFWSVDLLNAHPAFVRLNPFFHLIELVRAPLIGQCAHAFSWILCLVLFFAGSISTFLLYRIVFKRIPYWV